jgi:hypothetical protein
MGQPAEERDGQDPSEQAVQVGQAELGDEAPEGLVELIDERTGREGDGFGADDGFAEPHERHKQDQLQRARLLLAPLSLDARRADSDSSCVLDAVADPRADRALEHLDLEMAMAIERSDSAKRGLGERGA